MSLALPVVPGVLTAAEVARTVDSIAAVQLPSGMVPWFPGGHADPWNQVEAAMALAVGGRRREAEAGYDWLVGQQRPDGAWHQYYLADRVKEATLDANVCAYVATGVWHHFSLTGDRGFLEAMWPVVDAAVDFVLGLQAPGGEVIWARHADGTPWSFALLTGSSSICHSLGCALAAARRLGLERSRWERSRAALAHAVATRPGAFAPKDRWAMDWYYPVLSGVVRGDAGRRRLDDGWDRFILDGWGARCVHDRPWVTAAETAECAMAHLAVGLEARALDLLTWGQHLRADNGAYHTGIVLPEKVHFPGGERSTYSAAAVVLAADALSGTTPAAGVIVERPVHSGFLRQPVAETVVTH
ncbi:MAG: prenyltransferase [Acidimicrobiales bacterium]